MEENEREAFETAQREINSVMEMQRALQETLRSIGLCLEGMENAVQNMEAAYDAPKGGRPETDMRRPVGRTEERLQGGRSKSWGAPDSGRTVPKDSDRGALDEAPRQRSRRGKSQFDVKYPNNLTFDQMKDLVDANGGYSVMDGKEARRRARRAQMAARRYMMLARIVEANEAEGLCGDCEWTHIAHRNGIWIVTGSDLVAKRFDDKASAVGYILSGCSEEEGEKEERLRRARRIRAMRAMRARRAAAADCGRASCGDFAPDPAVK